MPKDETTQQPVDRALDRKFKRNMENVEGIVNDLSTSLWGSDATDEVSDLQDKFNSIMKTELDSITKGNKEDTTSFINKLYTNNKKSQAFNQMVDKEFLNLNMEGGESTLTTFISDAYRNRILKQADVHEVSSQLIELREALSTMRDAIVSPDINTGRINRDINFGNALEKDSEDYYTDTIEKVEERFELHKKIKDFITYNCLEQGEYFVYCIPYSEIFNSFMKNKDKYRSSRLYDYHESADEAYEMISKEIKLSSDDDLDAFCESCYEEYVANDTKISPDKKPIQKKEFKEDLKGIMDRISIVTDPIPLPVIEEGVGTMEEFQEMFVNESGDTFMEGKKNGEKLVSDNSFKKFMNNGDLRDGTYFSGDKKKSDKFDDVKDCYIKMVSGMELLPITIMDEEIGYFYIQTEEATPLSGLISGVLSYSKYDENRKEHTIINDIAGRIINRFDKKFLKENQKFKKLIVEAINYYDLNDRKIRFQFIPKEYIFPFRINTDENNHGRSMLEDSLFYAKLYLMLLLFKIMTIVTNSNDQKVNYIRQSGIDKNLTNKVQDIARQKQARKINMMDLFSYTTLLNKVGNGNELYIPTGRANERPIETEILSGQDVQLNTELMELLRNSYILGTGVPSAIMNYLNEADFAKSIETANTKFNGRVINYQLDLNSGLTELYRAILKWSTNIPESVIDEITITLPPPKAAANTVKQDLIQNFTAQADFLVQLYYGDQQDPNDEKEIAGFRKALARKYLNALNFDEIDEIFENNKKESQEEKLKPTPKEDLDNQLDI